MGAVCLHQDPPPPRCEAVPSLVSALKEEHYVLMCTKASLKLPTEWGLLSPGAFHLNPKRLSAPSPQTRTQSLLSSLFGLFSGRSPGKCCDECPESEHPRFKAGSGSDVSLVCSSLFRSIQFCELQGFVIDNSEISARCPSHEFHRDVHRPSPLCPSDGSHSFSLGGLRSPRKLRGVWGHTKKTIALTDA